jgi:glycosyltransferase involved in cell wall biosynthesis
VRTENQWVDAARNTAAALGKGEFLLFLDSDDVPARHAVERMREALVLSGDDCLIASSYMFTSSEMPYDVETGGTTAPVYALCVPLGMDLVGGLVDLSTFGGSMFLVRRRAFEALGGYLAMRGVGYEDYELYVRLALAGYKVDAMADLLQFYRQVDGGVARLFGTDPAKRRLLAPYEARLRDAGLAGVGLAMEALTARKSAMERKLRMLRARMNEPGRAKRNSFATEARGGSMGRLQQWYRSSLSMEMRLKIHRMFLSPFVGDHEPPSL